MSRRPLLVLASVALALPLSPAVAQTLVLDDPLDGSTSGTRNGGTFVPGGGWKVTALTDYIYWHVPGIRRGALELSVSGLNPNECRDGMNGKSELFHMYDHTYQSADTSYSGYRNNPFKHFMRKTNCTDYIPGRIDSMEMVWAAEGNAKEVDTPVLSWNPAVTYTFREEWGPDGHGNAVLTTTRNGQHVITISVPGTYQPAGLSVRVAASNRGAENEETVLDAVFSNVKVWDLGSPEPGPDAGSPFDAGAGARYLELGPVDDTFADPLEAAQEHGSLETMEVGGDGAGGAGRTIYLKFDLSEVQGTIVSASLWVTATNGGGGGAIAPVADNGWNEETLTWNNRPGIGGGPLSALGTVAIGTRYSWDVTAGLTGGGPRSFAVTSTETNGAAYATKEAGDPATRPLLAIVYHPGVNPPGPDASTTPPPGEDASVEPPPVGQDATSEPPPPGEDAGPASAEDRGDRLDGGKAIDREEPGGGACGCAAGGSAGALAFAAAVAGLGPALRRRRHRRQRRA